MHTGSASRGRLTNEAKDRRAGAGPKVKRTRFARTSQYRLRFNKRGYPILPPYESVRTLPAIRSSMKFWEIYPEYNQELYYVKRLPPGLVNLAFTMNKEESEAFALLAHTAYLTLKEPQGEFYWESFGGKKLRTLFKLPEVGDFPLRVIRAGRYYRRERFRAFTSLQLLWMGRRRLRAYYRRLQSVARFIETARLLVPRTPGERKS